ncbi:hypothetical protein [Flammeovirga sp. SJP92]|uniref:hypothetical protein n=1 Tax=Flammeovirga sp. SJP92 TaxID=1775430 RepID=UPI000787852F|nr:hypothetical protein [Flammeovirga sp. SJP92]KXX68920.1 hypothetical protein AVL50_17320 [Flammeovirga sp. SJP92]
MKNKSILTIILSFTVSFAFGQIDAVSDSLDGVITTSIDASQFKFQHSQEIEEGFYEVIKIDELSDFYLVFIQKDSLKRTIHSEKKPFRKGEQLKEGNRYFFKLSCKDTLRNGLCVPTIPHVTYFNKYIGHEIGQLMVAENLVGLSLKE